MNEAVIKEATKIYEDGWNDLRLRYRNHWILASIALVVQSLLLAGFALGFLLSSNIWQQVLIGVVVVAFTTFTNNRILKLLPQVFDFRCPRCGKLFFRRHFLPKRLLRFRTWEVIGRRFLTNPIPGRRPIWIAGSTLTENCLHCGLKKWSEECEEEELATSSSSS